MGSEDARPRNHAVLIGTSSYDDARYLPVPAAANSLRRMHRVLTDGRLCGWDPGDVTVFKDPDRQSNLALQLRLIAEETTGTFLVYFVGHGTTTERGELCLVTRDAHHDHPDVTGLPYPEVRAALMRSPAAVKIAILDCCSSGRAIQALSGAELADITAVSGTYTLTAADGPAHVVPLEQQESACTSFTREFCDLVQAGLPDGPDVLTLEDLWLPLRNRVRAAGLPLPNRKVYDTASHFPFTRNIALRSPQPAPRSASVRRGDTKALRKHVRIENIAARYTRLRGSGRELRGDCPLCDSDESSFSVSRDKQLFYCFDCHAGGHVIQLAMAMEHFSPTEAFDWLVRQAGLTETDSAGQPTSRDRLLEAHRLAVDFYRTQLESPQAAVARTFLAERGFDQAAAAHFGVGYSPASWDNLTRFLRDKGFTHKELTLSGLSQEGRRGPIDRFRGRLVWPIRDMIGDTVGFAARRLHDQDNGPKYITTPKTPIYDKSQVLFGIDLARKSIATSSRAVVVEGYTDVMACHMAGVNTAIAPCGTIFSSDHVHLLHRLLGEDGRGRTTFTFDGDEAGQRAALRFIESDQLFAAASYITIVPDGLNPCELRIAKGNEAVTDLAEPRIPLLEFVFQQIATRHNLQTPVGRVAALDEAAPLVARIKSSAFQHEIAVQLADMLKIRDTQFVARHVAQLAREARASASDSSAPLSRKPVYATERELLKLALQYPHLVSPTFDAYGADEFTAPPYAAVRQAILDAGGVEQGCKDPHAYLVSVREAAPDDAVRALVTELAIETVYRKTVDDAYAGDQLAHVRQRSVDRRIHYLQRALAVLGAGDDPVQQKGVESELWKLQQYAMDLRVRGVQAL